MLNEEAFDDVNIRSIVDKREMHEQSSTITISHVQSRTGTSMDDLFQFDTICINVYHPFGVGVVVD